MITGQRINLYFCSSYAGSKVQEGTTLSSFPIISPNRSLPKRMRAEWDPGKVGCLYPVTKSAIRILRFERFQGLIDLVAGN